jgi:potassium-transporting ATPase KdpC subunit
MLKQLRTAAVLLLVLTLLTGIIYPGLVTVFAQVVFPHQANGSFIERGEELIGSELIGQPFHDPRYFWGRLSATQTLPYNAAASSGSNYGPMHPALKEAALSRLAALGTQGNGSAAVPVDLVTSSASGLDPHISLAAAEFQLPRIAAARGMTEEAVRELVRNHSKGRQWGVLGEPRVNVLRLNLALDEMQTSD